MYKPGKLDNLLDRPETEKLTKATKQTSESIWQTIKAKLDEIQQAAIQAGDKSNPR